MIVRPDETMIFDDIYELTYELLMSRIRGKTRWSCI